jgi:putative drug exporter of the RND superfamily
LRALASIVTGRRTKWLILIAWVIVFAALRPLGSKLSDETVDDTASYLPQSAESTEVVHILDRDFSSG